MLSFRLIPPTFSRSCSKSKVCFPVQELSSSSSSSSRAGEARRTAAGLLHPTPELWKACAQWQWESHTGQPSTSNTSGQEQKQPQLGPGQQKLHPQVHQRGSPAGLRQDTSPVETLSDRDVQPNYRTAALLPSQQPCQ